MIDSITLSFKKPKNKNSISSLRKLMMLLLIVNLFLNFSYQAFSDENDEDPSAINVRQYEDFKVNAEIENNCDMRVMAAYSMYGDSPSLSTPNSVCPAIQQNCCGPRDQANIEVAWRMASNRIERNQKLFLLLAKGILTQSQDFLRLSIHGNIIYKRLTKDKIALEMVQKDYPGVRMEQGQITWHNRNYKLLINKDFIETTAGVEFGIDADKLKLMYHNFNQAMEFMMNIRRTFYCMICSVEGQRASNRKGMFKRIFYPDDIYYGTPFCDALINHHFRYFYDYYYFFKRLQRLVDFLPFFIQKTSEFNPNTTSPLDNNTRQTETSGTGSDYIRKEVTIPFGRFLYTASDYSRYKSNYNTGQPSGFNSLSIQACSDYMNFTACEFYCQEFSMVKQNDRFDGDPDFLFRTFNVMMAVRDSLSGFRENEMEVDFVSIEKITNELQRKYDPLIYVSTMPGTIEFDSKGNDFSELVGFNPFAMAANCTLELKFKNVGRVVLGLFLAVTSFFAFV